MKPITEQERKDLISHGNDLKGRIEHIFHKSDFESKTLRLVEIALASLTSEVAFEVTRSIVSSCGDHSITCKLVGGSKSLVNGDVPRHLYTAPPVSVIKFPEEIDNWSNSAKKVMGSIEFCGDSKSFTVGANWMLSEIKRLNGIK